MLYALDDLEYLFDRKKVLEMLGDPDAGCNAFSRGLHREASRLLGQAIGFRALIVAKGLGASWNGN
jgi:hypothetical protein